jgi:hypothetical protein
MVTFIVSISNKMQRYTVYLYLETTLHASGGISTHHQERIQLYLQHLIFVTSLLLSAAIVEELEPVWVCCGWRTPDWLRFFRAFSSVVRQMPGWNPQRRGTARTLPKFCVGSIYFLFCVFLCIVWVYMCTVLLPPGGYPIAVKYIISYHISYHNIISYISSYRIIYHIFYIISYAL